MTYAKAPLRGIGAAVRFHGIAKSYGTVNAVRDFDLDVAPGEFVSILGPSGSGKTTTLMMLAGFEAPTAGSITIDGRDVTRLPPHHRNIGTVYQNYALFPHMTVAQNVAFPLKMRNIGKQEISARVAEALALVRLEDFGNRMPAQLSGGQQQRVAIARALVFRPPLVLMDEPLGALDKKLREELQSEIKRIQSITGSTIIYVTHDQDEALRMSDRVVVMNKAAIADVGPPAEVYDRPNSSFVASFLGTANFFTGDVADGTSLVLPSGLTLPLERGRCGSGCHTVAVRPERMRISRPDAAVGAVWSPARIVGAAYHGHSHILELELATGEGIFVTQPSNSAEIVTAPGADVVVHLDPHDVHVLGD